MPPKSRATLAVERVSVSSISVHPKNARVGDVALIAASLQQHGLYKPLVVQKSTGYVLAGNHTLQAAEQLGWTEVEVVRLDVDEQEATRILLVDNRSSDTAGYDDELLAGLLESLPDLSGTGYSEDDLDDLLATTNLPEPLPIEKQKGNGGKALTGLGLQWGYIQWKSRRVQITADEVARLDALHDKYVADNGTEAGFGHWVADAVLGPVAEEPDAEVLTLVPAEQAAEEPAEVAGVEAPPFAEPQA